jgi:hypothetical protein
MDYKIIRAHEEIGQIEVAYLNGSDVVGIYAIDVPVENGAFIVGQQLEDLIQLQAPVWLTQRQSNVAAASNFHQIQSLVEELPAPLRDPQAEANMIMWDETNLESQVAKVLVKFGVLESDPTTIQVAKL